MDLVRGDRNERNLKRNEERKLRDNILFEESWRVIERAIRQCQSVSVTRD